MTQSPDALERLREPEGWQSGRPTEPGIYVGFSAYRAATKGHPSEKPDLYTFNGKQFQHWTGWYDNAVDRWIKLDMPYSEADQKDRKDGSSKPNKAGATK